MIAEEYHKRGRSIVLVAERDWLHATTGIGCEKKRGEKCLTPGFRSTS